MKTIAFFISDHGYGHIMRNAPLIQWLLTNSDVHIMVVSGENHINALKIYLGKTIDKEIIDSRMVSISMNTDLGIIVKTGSLRIDSEAMVIKVAHYLGNFPALVQKGEAIIVENNVNLCVVDIVPWALEAASNCNVPSVLMASFTWIEQYENFIPSYLLEPFKCLYLKADKVIKYHLSTRMVNKIYPNSKEYGYCCRSANGFEPVCPKSYFKNNYQTVFM